MVERKRSGWESPAEVKIPHLFGGIRKQAVGNTFSGLESTGNLDGFPGQQEKTRLTFRDLKSHKPVVE